MAKTYGQASNAALSERQANGDPLKWRKFVSYAEFTAPHTPAEEHHIPGYSGHVPGVYADNLYAKTYGKTTLQAVRGDYHKGCVQQPTEQYKTSCQTLLGDTACHPGKPQDIMPGGASWTGASPYNVVVDKEKELEPVNPYPPSMVQIAGGKEPAQPSPLLKNFPAAEETMEPALRIASKPDPHDRMDPAKNTMSQTGGPFQIPGYSGFVPGVQSENLFAGTYAAITAKADDVRDRKTGTAHLDPQRRNAKGVVPLHPESAPRPRTAEMPTTKVDGPAPHTKHLPGYTGFVPGMQAETIFGRTYGHATHVAMAGDHNRFQWCEQAPEERFQSSAQNEMIDFGHPAKIKDGHVTYAHEHSNPARANYLKAKAAPGGHKYHIPGYGGFVPGIQSRNMFGMTNKVSTTAALKDHYGKLAERPKTAPDAATKDDPQLGMLQFKPNGFQYQKRMQGEWNNGMLGSRNYSAVKLSEGNIWKGDSLLNTTSKELHQGHANSDAPKIFSKGNPPTYENMDHALKHKSVYLGYYAL